MKDFSVMVDALCDLAGIQKPRLGAQGAEPRSDAISRERKA
jgi:hypothetical protein